MSLHRVLHTFRTRPRLLVAILVAIGVGWGLPDAWMLRASTRVLVAWNVGVLCYLVLVVHMCWGATHDSIRRRARLQAESRVVAIGLVLLGAWVAVAAIMAELAAVRDLHGSLRTAHIGLTALTILSAWAFSHTMFGLHYAHDYYDALAHQRVAGLEFPGTPDPDYADFMYFAFIIGTSGQTADVAFTSRPMRRAGAVHCVFAFLFNTTLLALTINIASGLL